MKKIAVKQEVWIWAIMILPVLYLAFVWPSLPGIVPTHFDLAGTPDAWGSKHKLLYLVIVLPPGMYLLLTMLQFIYLGQQGNAGRNGSYFILKLAVTLFMSAVAFLAIHLASLPITSWAAPS